MFLNNSRQQPNHGRTRRADWGCWQGWVGLCRFSGHLQSDLFFNQCVTSRDEMFDVISRSTDDCNLYGVEPNLDRDRAQCNNHQLFVIVSPIMSPQLLLIVANFQPNYFLDKLGPTSQVINPKHGSAPILWVNTNYRLHHRQCSIWLPGVRGTDDKERGRKGDTGGSQAGLQGLRQGQFNRFQS